MSTYSTIKSSSVILTPAKAQEYLDRMDRNRPVKQQVVERYARDIKAGNFLAGTSIQFDWNGKMKDGQHRCLAVVETGMPIEVVVIEGVSPKAMMTIDTGAGRKLSDNLAILGEKYAPKLSALVNYVYEFDAGSPFQSYAAPTRLEGMEFFGQNADAFREAVEKQTKWGRGTRLTESVIGFSYLLTARNGEYAQSDAEEFFERVSGKVGLKPLSPELALVNWIERNLGQSSKGKHEVKYQAALTLKALNYFRIGKEVELIRWNGGGAMAEAFPTPVIIPGLDDTYEAAA